jgi:hypothetical protein
MFHPNQGLTYRFCRYLFKVEDGVFDQMYFAGLGGLGIYILYKLMEKSK